MKRYIGADSADTIAERRDGQTTAAGMGTTIDLILHLIAEQVPPHVVRTVSAALLHDRIRLFDAKRPAQRFTPVDQIGPDPDQSRQPDGGRSGKRGAHP
ncbi:MAG: hypothetical protein ACOH2H_00215 [Cypionkella sp.]